MTDANCLRERHTVCDNQKWVFHIDYKQNCNKWDIISPFFWSTKYVKSLSACSGNRSSISKQERSCNYACAEHYLQQSTYLWAVICRSHGELSANEKEGKNWMIVRLLHKSVLVRCLFMPMLLYNLFTWSTVLHNVFEFQ